MFVGITAYSIMTRTVQAAGMESFLLPLWVGGWNPALCPLKCVSCFVTHWLCKRGARKDTRISSDEPMKKLRFYHEQRQQDITIVSCDNPYCDKLFSMSRKQKLLWNTLNPKNGTVRFKYCSTKCQEDHFKALNAPHNHKKHQEREYKICSSKLTVFLKIEFSFFTLRIC